MTKHRKFILPNGVPVSAERLEYARSVLISVWVLAGSRHESPNQFGISHLLEHLVFKGTRSRKIYHIANGIESAGGYINAMTDKEATCYYVRIPADHIEKGIDILSDLVLHPVFREDETEKEKQVVLDELSSVEDNIEDWIGDLFEELVFDGSDLAHPVIGTRDTVAGISLQDIESRSKLHHVPEKLLITVTGFFEFHRLEALLDKYFRLEHGVRISTGSGAVSFLHPQPVIEFTRPVSQSHISIGRQTPSASDDQSTALMLINAVAGGGMSSRLNLRIREKYGFCYSIYSFTSFYSDFGAFGIYAATDPKKFNKMESLIRKELDILQRDGLTSREFTQVKTSLTGNLAITSESMSGRHQMMARSELQYGRNKPLQELISEIELVREEDIQDYFEKYPFNASLSTVRVFGES
ncbi:MAG: insulinase family protein [Bacteroidetes bacterium]|nr:insulinase family protein [Bacteroidota bacterium]